jgi:alkanesulfonate monooxygenase SsuD/methylene tetrahydromethanopterin reductase-like flavin-dependent oxidoreductase (luciferase family)
MNAGPMNAGPMNAGPMNAGPMSCALSFPAEVELTTTEIVELSRRSEEIGLDTVWVAEGRGGEAFATIAAILLQTRRIKVGAGILPVFNRSPWLVAMGASVLDELGGNRVLLGLGPGHRAVVEDRHGLTYERPLARVRETADIVHAALTGDVVNYEGEVFTLRGAQLSHPARRGRIPIYMAATGPRALQLAGTVADGAFLILTTPTTTARAIGQLHASARAAGRDPAGLHTVSYLFTCVSGQRDRARDASRRTLAYYGRLAHYRQLYTAAGFADAAEDLRRAWATRPGTVAEAVPDEMVDAFTASGTADDVASALRRFAGSGLGQLALYPYPAIGQRPSDGFHAVLDALDQVRPGADRVARPEPARVRARG